MSLSMFAPAMLGPFQRSYFHMNDKDTVFGQSDLGTTAKMARLLRVLSVYKLLGVMPHLHALPTRPEETTSHKRLTDIA